ncbi:Panacea domain-containing protein [Methylocapsa palsarum]|uniref:Uncharacterized phage-associated protein n=1 Tax=Methylocapsa palsarum TaxID=1612308 RepID=A0A1I3Z5Q4_9HYPH|nr:type II toxin-antitoxin system antitoxin SocA domain-containing protein [Methylocapsa palsarum]SFK39373.1 Uncharacterized phage-associated protein [Methylocapsa palsarum]
MKIRKSFEIPAREIAKWFVLVTDRESGNVITQLKVQKLIYYAQGWSLAKLNRPLFDEDLQAWVHGPVARSVYDFYKGAGYDALPEKKLTCKISGEPLRLLSAVNDTYSVYSAKGLEKKTHSEPPWIAARAGALPEERCENVISKESMAIHFASL